MVLNKNDAQKISTIRGLFIGPFARSSCKNSSFHTIFTTRVCRAQLSKRYVMVDHTQTRNLVRQNVDKYNINDMRSMNVKKGYI